MSRVRAADPIVVVGASLAGTRFIRAARRAGYDGDLIVLGDEHHQPYDRPPLSKEFLTAELDEDSVGLAIRGDVDLRLGVRATSLDTSTRTVECDDGTSMTAAHVVIATGAHARWLPGTEGLSRVHVLRTLDDAIGLRDSLGSAGSLAIVGAGFIGCEVAASARHLGLDVTLIDPLEAPVVRGVGRELGSIIGATHAARGVDVRCGVGVTAVTEGTDGAVVTCDDGSTVEADVVLVGIGAAPTTDWLADSALTIDNGVVTDARLAAIGGGGHVWAMGDVASFQSAQLGTHVRHEHWTSADEQAKAVAANLFETSAAGPFEPVPYVWSDQYDFRVQVLGQTGRGLPLESVDGSLADLDGVGVYLDDGVTVGAIGIGRPRALMALRAVIEAAGDIRAVHAAIEAAG